MAENNKSRFGTSFLAEFIRFLIIGLYGTLIDYVVEVWAASLFSGWIASNPGNHLFAYLTTFVLGFAGFIIATPATWSLNAVWVFRNVEDEGKTRSLKGALLFTLWAFFGLLLASIIHFLGYMICLEWTDMNINILEINFSTLFQQDAPKFWAFTIVFVLKTGVSTIFNYVTRKLILFKGPKTE